MKIREIWSKVSAEHSDLIFNLAERWDDEKKYEDIKDYFEVIKKKIPEAIKMHKQPFGFDAEAEDGIITVSVYKSKGYLKLTGKVSNKPNPLMSH